MATETVSCNRGCNLFLRLKEFIDRKYASSTFIESVSRFICREDGMATMETIMLVSIIAILFAAVYSFGFELEKYFMDAVSKMLKA